MLRCTRGGLHDRWHGPGATDWWGFEAVDPGRHLVFCLRIAVADPMDPHWARELARTNGAAEPPRPERHVLVRAVVYRHGRRILARTVRPPMSEFRAASTSGAVEAGPARVRVEETAGARRYIVEVDPGTRLEWTGPAGVPAGVEPLREPVWDLSALDLHVRGTVQPSSGPALPFEGRGVHEHGAAPAAMAYPVRTWAWGWAHAWDFAVAWRQVVTDDGAYHTLLIVDEAGRTLLDGAARSRRFRERYSLLGVPYRRQWRLDAEPGAGLAVERLRTLASSPIGMRFLTNIRFSVESPPGRLRLVDGIGLTSVARPFRVRVAPVRWLLQARDLLLS